LNEAFFFGPSDQQLFGMYHPPAGGDGLVLTIICPPLFVEYMRTHLALRELALSLAADGQHVLRFDYRGTGDSFGELAQVGIAEWREDIALALQEGRELTGCSIVRVLGVRAGGLLACGAVGASDEIERIVLWDPIPDGAAYLDQLQRTHASMVELQPALHRAERAEMLHEHAGHRLSRRMLDELRSFDGRAYVAVPQEKLRVVSTSSEFRLPLEGIQQHVTRFACDWETTFADRMMPKPVLERLNTCLTLP
jgi:pimeloyl-ACP methyl ester carboxylesterase